MELFSTPRTPAAQSSTSPNSYSLLNLRFNQEDQGNSQGRKEKKKKKKQQQQKQDRRDQLRVRGGYYYLPFHLTRTSLRRYSVDGKSKGFSKASGRLKSITFSFAILV
ncbi:hypothetical protein TWF730_003213 [Orbilia blumenaviensis]|uniref:Uncharacterized protein n=1 Tax=Orbilia blumenaviensis TaxID=1796055 RepID=A0AAV9U7B4_9PEZI